MSKVIIECEVCGNYLTVEDAIIYRDGGDDYTIRLTVSCQNEDCDNYFEPLFIYGPAQIMKDSPIEEAR